MFALLHFIYLRLVFNCNIFKRFPTLQQHLPKLTVLFLSIFWRFYWGVCSYIIQTDFILALYLLASIDFNYSILKWVFPPHQQHLHTPDFTGFYWGVCSYITCLVYYCTWFICICRFQLQPISLKAGFLKFIFFSPLHQYLHAPKSFIPICIQNFFTKGFVYISYGWNYATVYSKIILFLTVDGIFCFMEW